jgi:uncharacterized hydrophobic protein (TIGR00271 family)
MMFLEQFNIVSDKEKTESVARLIKASTGDFDFYLFALFGISMASFGLVLNSPEVIIGSMLIAPILYPLLSLSLALVLFDLKLMYRSLRTLIISFTASIFIAFFISVLVYPFFKDALITEQILSRVNPSTLYFLVAFISGFAATYALVHANLNEMLPGVAISVSLVPPLATVGIALGAAEFSVAGGALVLFLVNAVGIAFASVIAFTFMTIHGTYKVADSAIRQEEKRLQQEAKKIEKIKNNHE